MWPAGPFSFREPAGSCLTSAELIWSSASSLSGPLGQAYWLCLAGKPAWGLHRGRQPPAGTIGVPGLPAGPASLSVLLLGSGPTGGMKGHSCSPHASALRVTMFPAHLPLCVVASPAISDTSSLGPSRASLGSHSQLTLPAHTTHSLSGFLPFRVWSFFFIQRA